MHGFESLHVVPFALPAQKPHGITIFAVKQLPGMKQWPALPLKNCSVLPLHVARKRQCANGNRKVAWPLVFVVLLPDVMPSSESGVTARPEIGLPLPSTTVTTDGWLTRMVAVVQAGCAQANVVLL